MDGPRLAYAVKGGSTCTRVFAWNVLNGAQRASAAAGTCAADSTSTGGGVTEIAVAGTRLAWIVNRAGTAESADFLYTASVPRPREKLVANVLRTGDVDGSLAGGWIGGLVGSRRPDRGRPVHHERDRNDRDRSSQAPRPGADHYRRGQGDAQRCLARPSPDRGAPLRREVVLYDTETGRLLLTVTPSSAREVALRQGLHRRPHQDPDDRDLQLENRCARAGPPRRGRGGEARCPLGHRRLRRRAHRARPPARRREGCRSGDRPARDRCASRSRRPGSPTPTTPFRETRTSVTSPSCRCASATSLLT